MSELSLCLDWSRRFCSKSLLLLHDLTEWNAVMMSDGTLPRVVNMSLSQAPCVRPSIPMKERYGKRSEGVRSMASALNLERMPMFSWAVSPMTSFWRMSGSVADSWSSFSTGVPILWRKSSSASERCDLVSWMRCCSCFSRCLVRVDGSARSGVRAAEMSWRVMVRASFSPAMPASGMKMAGSRVAFGAWFIHSCISVRQSFLTLSDGFS